MAVLNYAEIYERALQQKFTAGLRFNRLYATPNNNQARFVDAKTVKFPSISTTGLVDVNRDAVGGFARNVDNAWEVKTLTHDREFSTLVDPMDIDETNLAVSIANITNVFNIEQKIPEMDKYMVSKLYADYLAFGEVADNTAITPANALNLFDSYMQAMDDAEVPYEGRILYVTPAVYKALKQAEGLERVIQVGSPERTIDRNVRSLDDVQIETVPSSRMLTAYNYTNGAVPAAGAKQINMLLIHPAAIIAPMKYELVSLDQPSAVTKGKYLYYERKYWDVFVFQKKVKALKFNVSA